MSLGPFAPIPPREKIRRSHINDLRTALTGIQDAYDVAVANGFVGTRGQWLDSLKGEKGDPGAGLAPIGSAETVDDLPSDGNTEGDVRTADDTGRAYRWDGSEWVDVGLFRGPGGVDTELRARVDPGTAGAVGQVLGNRNGVTAWLPDGTGAALLELVRQQATGVTLKRVNATTYHLFAHLSGDRAIRWELRQFAPGGGPATVFALDEVDGIYQAVPQWSTAKVDNTDPSIAYTGTWVSAEGGYGSNLRRTTTVGDFVEWTTPATTRLGVLRTRATNMGLAAITLDGSPTAATALPTAQQVVDAGMFPVTILAANGGTLNPTDRVLDMYGSPFTQAVETLIADGLADVPHTVRMTKTAYKNTTSSQPEEQRVEIDGYYYQVPGTVPEEQVERLNGLGSVSEYALQIDYNGTRTFVGNGHGRDQQTGLTFALDGMPVDPADGQSVSGDELVITRVSELSHPGAPGGIGSVTLEYRLTRGVLTITWAWTPTISTASPLTKLEYPMSAVSTETEAGFTRGRVLSMPADLMFTAHDGTLHSSPGVTDTALFWQPQGRFAHIMHVPDPARTFSDHTMSIYIQDRQQSADRPDLYMAKAYFEHVGPKIVAGQTLRSQAMYAFADLINPDLLLAR